MEKSALFTIRLRFKVIIAKLIRNVYHFHKFIFILFLNLQHNYLFPTKTFKPDPNIPEYLWQIAVIFA